MSISSDEGLKSLSHLAARVRAAGPLVVLGSKGQVGRALIRAARICPNDSEGQSSSPSSEVVGLCREDLDLADLEQVKIKLQELRPSVLINAAAFTAVDLAESEGEQAHRLNARLPGCLAEFCQQQQIPFVHYSTDYVFSGEGSRPWKEDDPTGPLNVYGQTKLEGERAVAAAGGRHLIFRTSWVYDEQGKNFLTTMLRLGAEREQLSVVSDQVGAPSYAKDLAELTLKALDQALKLSEGTELSEGAKPWGLYHMCSRGHASWYEFAQAIFVEARKRGLPLRIESVKPILTQDYPTAAKRPLNSRLDLSQFTGRFALSPPHWQEALEACMANVSK